MLYKILEDKRIYPDILLIVQFSYALPSEGGYYLESF